MIRMFLSYPLLSQHRDEAGKRTIETGEIRVGKAMVDKRDHWQRTQDSKACPRVHLYFTRLSPLLL